MTARDTETHLVLIPSYNTGQALLPTVTQALRHWPIVWVVIDGSTDGSDAQLTTLSQTEPGLRIIRRARNAGKGAAVLTGLDAAQNFSHVLIMDADGQHPAFAIPDFMLASKQNRRAMILGAPQFDSSAPRIRVIWRKISNFLTRLETSREIADSLFGFRVYPLTELRSVMQAARHMRGFDFDTEAIVRLSWRGTPAINRPVPVRYFRKDQGGVSHFRYARDNFLLAAMHARLLATAITRLPRAKPLKPLSHRAVD